MRENIVVVESPAKSKTIEKYLGPNYQVLASFGHVRDLPKSELGVDTEHNFEPRYVIPTKSRKTISALKDAFKSAKSVYLATDYDREGEAIAWHILNATGLNDKKNKLNVYRITFHEITKTALEEAIKSPRKIDEDLVDAQQARRVLDRLVGYKLSPFLWKKVTKGLSAGRVQSVAVRLIVDREREIEAFKPEEYWSVESEFKVAAGVFTANLSGLKGKSVNKLAIKSKEESDAIVNAIKEDNFVVSSVDAKAENKYPSPPFTTSTLQQDASRRLRFSSKQTMKLAQDLYEAGLITYMRTDSIQVASIAAVAAKSYITSTYGAEYVPSTPRQFKNKIKGAQEAHEAIRPTDPAKHPESLGVTWTDKHTNLYKLIWQRFLGSQMKEALLDKLAVQISGQKSKTIFTANGQKVRFAGFLKVYPITIEEKTLPDIIASEVAELLKTTPSQHFTEPPRRFTEASLVKTLEELGIGRPSTYAPTISTISDRGYVRIEKQTFYPQEIGLIVTDLLKEHFPSIVDTGFTAKMEEQFDDVAHGKTNWRAVLAEFWEPFNKQLLQKTEEVTKQNVAKELDEVCPQCKKNNLVERLGRFGKFIACSGFPECKYSRQIISDTAIECSECKTGSLIERRTRKGGRLFWGCSNYPNCKHATWNDPAKAQKTEEETKTEEVTVS